MPNRPTTLRRWQIGGAFLVLTAAFTFSLLSISHESRDATRLSQQNQQLLAQVIRDRTRTIQRLHQQNVESCQSRHRLYLVLRAVVTRGVQEAKTILRSPTSRLAGVADAERMSIRSSRQFLRDLHGADCHKISVIRVKPKP